MRFAHWLGRHRAKNPGCNLEGDLVPVRSTPLTTATQNVPPMTAQPFPTPRKHGEVPRHGMVALITFYHPSYPCADGFDWLVHHPAQLLLDNPEFRPHPLGGRVPPTTKRPFEFVPQKCVNPRNVKVFGFASPRFRDQNAAKRPNSINRVSLRVCCPAYGSAPRGLRSACLPATSRRRGAPSHHST